MDLDPCVMCELGIDHRHIDGLPPGQPCRSCFVSLHGYCDPATYWCTCDCGLKDEEITDVEQPRD